MVNLGDYYNTYLDYYKKAEDIERETYALREIETESNALDKDIIVLERDRKSTKEILDDKTKHYNTQRKLLSASERKLGVNRRNTDVTASLNEYTNLDIFEQNNEELRTTCEESKQIYIADRESTLQSELSSLKRKLEIFEDDKAETIDRIISGLGDKGKLEEKKEDVLDYLNATRRVKAFEESQRIIQLIESPVDPSWYNCSESKLLNDMLSLDSTDGYIHDGKFDFDDYMKSTEKYTSGVFPLLLLISTIALLVYFMMGHSPLNFIIPSSYSVADASSSVVNTGLSVVKVLGAIGIGIIVGGIIGIIASYFVGGIIGGIISIVFAVIVGRFFYFRFSPNIHASSMIGFGNVVHTIIAFLINLILVLVIMAIIFFVFSITPLARFIYRINPERLKDDLNYFEKYVNDNKIAYISLFHYTDAVGYAFENRMKSAIEQKEEEISSIREEDGYLKIDKEYQQKIKERNAERSSQIDAIKCKLETYKKGVDEYTAKHISINNMIDVKKKQLANLRKKQAEKECVINEMTSQLDAAGTYLTNQTQEIVGGTERGAMADDMFDKECMMRNTSMNLLECNGQLSKQIYFVRKEKDKRGFAELKMMDISCQHTVFIYEHETTMWNNISEELCNFIKWFVEAVRRENPAALLEKFDVIDVVSGRGILTMPPYNRFLNVVSDEKGKQILADNLKKRGEVISGEMSAVHIQEWGRKVDNVDKLNAVKAEINKPEILQEPDIPVRSLIEAFIPYKILIFIVPDVNYDGSQPSVLNEDLRRILNNTELYGIVPVFFISHNTWVDTKKSSDTVYLHALSNKIIYRVKNIGSIDEKQLDL